MSRAHAPRRGAGSFSFVVRRNGRPVWRLRSRRSLPAQWPGAELRRLGRECGRSSQQLARRDDRERPRPCRLGQVGNRLCDRHSRRFRRHHTPPDRDCQGQQQRKGHQQECRDQNRRRRMHGWNSEMTTFVSTPYEPWNPRSKYRKGLRQTDLRQPGPPQTTGALRTVGLSPTLFLPLQSYAIHPIHTSDEAEPRSGERGQLLSRLAAISSLHVQPGKAAPRWNRRCLT